MRNNSKIQKTLKENLGYNARFWGNNGYNGTDSNEEYITNVINQVPHENSYMRQYKKKLEFGNSFSLTTNSWNQENKMNSFQTINTNPKSHHISIDSIGIKEKENPIKVLDYNRLVKEERLFKTIDNPLNAIHKDENDEEEYYEMIDKVIFIQRFFRNYLASKEEEEEEKEEGVKIDKYIDIEEDYHKIQEMNVSLINENQDLKKKLYNI